MKRGRPIVSRKKGQAVLRWLEKYLRPELRTIFRADSCIGSTRAAIMVLDHFGMKARAMPTLCAVGNAEFARLVRERGWPADVDMTESWRDECGAWVVGLGGGTTSPTTYDHHLVCIVENHILLDAAIDQAARPAANINPPPVFVCNVSPEFARGRENMLQVSSTLLVMYQPKVDSVYKQTPDWRFGDRYRELVPRIIARMEADLEDSGAR